MAGPHPARTPDTSVTSRRPLTAGDTIRVRSLSSGLVEPGKKHWLIGRIGTVRAVLAGGQHAEVSIEVSGLPVVANRRTVWTLAVCGLEVTAAPSPTVQRRPRPGDRVLVDRIFLSHGTLGALKRYLEGQNGQTVAMCDGSHALVELEETVPAPGGRARRFTFHLGDLTITPAAPEPAFELGYGTALTGDRLRHAIAIPAGLRPGPVTAVCGTFAEAVLIGEWSPPFDVGLMRTCRACATALGRQEPPHLCCVTPADPPVAAPGLSVSGAGIRTIPLFSIVYLAACSAMDVAPHDTVALENSPVGAAAALDAGLYLVGVPYLPGTQLGVNCY
ncbi:hypothetical protein [Streptosporangium sp. CA-115845]|uniref:hypothetical protein n=1 Tax=Streptosporangium sp. CA-115845 TaxID=3240071 RepID=UPI003D8E1197